MTRPFLCRGDDGWLYYVKGNAAGHSSLICEWIAGQLGRRLGLPIPDFRLAIIPKDLVTLKQVRTLLWRFETDPAIFWGAA